jgi:multiple sugar transport system substrate-binding protein
LSACGASSLPEAADAEKEDTSSTARQGTDLPDTPQDPGASGSDTPQRVYVQPEMSGEISISVYESAEWLETAVLLFAKKYPDMEVRIQSFYQGTDMLITEGGSVTMNPRPAGQTREDYIAQLNTQLLSGNAADIVITSIGLPIGRYIQMGVFEDLSFYLESAEEISDDAYYWNIFDACRTKSGALYQLPLSAMAIPLLRFEKELMEHTGLGPAPGTAALTWREALDLGKAMYQASTLPNTFLDDAGTIVGNLFTKAAVAAVDYDTGKITLDRESLLRLLAVYEELEDYRTVPEGFDFYSNEYHQPYTRSYQSDVEAALGVLSGQGVCLQWKHDDGNVYLSPYYALDFGITAQSRNQGPAWEFLRFLLSEEVQTLPSFPYAGVNRKGLQARVEGYLATAGLSEKAEEVLAMVDGWVSQITAYRSEDSELIQLTESLTKAFKEGELTAQETIDTLASRLEQYMNE